MQNDFSRTLRILFSLLGSVFLILVVSVVLFERSSFLKLSALETSFFSLGTHLKPSALIFLEPAKTFVSLLDGRKIFSEEKTPVAVVIENHPDAREQQQGLSEASIVYEVLAEGGITRFLAFYSSQEPDWVGPVRSARPYFVDFAEEYGAAFVHAGGSEEALSDLFFSDETLNIEGLYWEEVSTSEKMYFIRDRDYRAPHNLFGSFEGIRSIMLEKQWTEIFQDPPFSFGIMEASYATKAVADFGIDFSYDDFAVRYVYDPSSDHYLRFQAGATHKDQDRDIIPKNVLVQFVSAYPIDSEGRLSIQTQGKGEALLFTGGYEFVGSWEKDEEGRTSFYDKSGQSFLLRPGQTWIEIVDDADKIRI